MAGGCAVQARLRAGLDSRGAAGGGDRDGGDGRGAAQSLVLPERGFPLGLGARSGGRRLVTSRSAGHFCSRFQAICSPSRAEQSTYPAVQRIVVISGHVCRPGLIRSIDRQAAQQAREDGMLGMRPTGVLTAINRLDSHAAHERRDVLAADVPSARVGFVAPCRNSPYISLR